MAHVLWVIAITITYLGFDSWLDDQKSPNAGVDPVVTADGTKEIDLRRNWSGHYTVDGFLNDHPVTFIIDTGASNVSVPVSIARKAELGDGRKTVAQTANGNVGVEIVKVDKVTAGGISARGVKASVNPGLEGNQVLLGMSFLSDVDLIHSEEGMKLMERRD